MPLVRLDSSTHLHGLALYLHKSLPIVRVPNLESPGCSFICLRLSLLHSISYLFFLYRSPSDNDCSVIDAVSSSIDNALNIHPSASIFVFGDFNVHHSEWLPHSNRTDLAGELCLNFSMAHDLSQIVTFPTRFPDNCLHQPSLLDLFLTSVPDSCSVSSSPPFGSSDHAVVDVEIDFSVKSSVDRPFHRKTFNYKKADWDGFRDFLRDVPWSDIFSGSPNSAAKELTDWLLIGIDTFVPHRKFETKPHSPPWFSSVCASAIAHRNYYFNQYRRDGSAASRQSYRRASNACKRVISEAKTTYSQRIRESISSQKIGSRDFWRIYNSVVNSGKSAIPPLFNGLQVISSSKDKANLLAQLFAENSSLDDSDAVLPEFPAKTDRSLDSITITPKEVSKVLSSLDQSKASGPDSIPVVVLKHCAPELSSIFSKLFNLCLSQSCFPACWKESSVVPIFKNAGDRSDPSKYRPVSLLSVISKVFERLINKRLVGFLESLDLFSDVQYGFRGSRSTADLLTVVTERIHRFMDNSGEGRAIALDISKAFDRVWHSGLLHKLQAYGISGKILGIIKSFLTDRSLRVTLDGVSSSSFPINAGVPQGSILGPTLFLLYINDLPENILQNIDIFADDTTLYSGVSSRPSRWDQLEYAADLELDLKSVVDWGKKWLVSFNPGKTQLVSFNRKRDPFLPEIYMNGATLDEKPNLKLLGLSFSSNLSWDSYIRSISLSASRKVGALYRSKHFLTPDAILYLYKSTIRPCMEYCCHVWAGESPCHLKVLDRIQKRICNLVGSSHSSSLESLSHRRDVASLSLFYKYYHGVCSSELSDLLPPSFVPSRVTRWSSGLHKFAVQVPHFKTTSYSRSFFPRTASLWNSLPADCFPPTYNLNLFKSKVNRHLLSLS